MFLRSVERLAKPSIMIGAFILFVGIMIPINTVFAPDFKYLTQTFGYTAKEAYKMIESYGVLGRALHLKVLFADIAMVILYSIFFSTTIYKAFNVLMKKKQMVSILCFIPFMLAVIQMIEIILLFIILTQYPKVLESLAELSGYITSIKIALTPICFLLPLVGCAGVIMKKILVKGTKGYK